MDTHDLPDMEGLLEGIKDHPSIAQKQKDEKKPEPKPAEETMPKDDEQWNRFMANLDICDKCSSADKEERLVCKLDRDLADSLDDCNINNMSRSDLVNAIVRTFFDFYLPKLAEYRRTKRSLFANYNPSQA